MREVLKCFFYNKSFNVQIESNISRTEPSRLVVNSDSFKGYLAFNLIPEQKIGNIEIQVPNQWSYISQFNYEPNEQFVTLKSNTESKGRKIVSLNSQLTQKERSFLSIETPDAILSIDSIFNESLKNVNLKFETEIISHKSTVQWNPKQINFFSNTLKNRQQLSDLDYNYNGFHALNLETPEYLAQFEGQYLSQPFSRIGLKNKQSQYDHKTEPEKSISKYCVLL